jgi:bifunctional DNA-binding transcriptional regulator/antitoxin component of YhaV-PrlF toxin-antitoxin module
MAYILSTQLRVTLPKGIRDYLKVTPGDAVNFRIVADGTVRVEPVAAPSAPQTLTLSTARKRFEALRGSGGQSGTSGTDALMALLRGHDRDVSDPGSRLPKTTTRKR